MFRKMMYKIMVFISKRMIACDEAGFLLSYRFDKRLGFVKWIQLKFHLITCHLCRKYAIQIEQLNSAIEHYRVECNSETCHHHLPENTRTALDAVIVRELNAK